MRRLVYAPACYAFIYSTNLGKLIDVSADCVSGSVDRKTGDVSTARIVLRNNPRDGSDRGKYIRQEGKQVFMPNDLITIWLQRAAGKPIQQFTGYLDSVPMFEMYPRAVELTATCTLKKLAYMWFDPGVEFFRTWAAESGWVFDPATGSATNPTYNIGGDSNDEVGQLGDLPEVERKARLDGGFATLLYRFMDKIVGWPEQRIHISNIDPRLPEIAAKKFSEVNGDVEEVQAELVDIMRDLIGVSQAGVREGISPTGAVDSQITSALSAMKPVLDAAGIPMLVATYVARHQTAFIPTFSQSPTSGRWGYGIFARKPRTRSSSTADRIQYEDSIRGVALNQMSVKAATEIFCTDIREALNDAIPGRGPVIERARAALLTNAGTGQEQALKTLVTAYLAKFDNSELDEASFVKDLETARQYATHAETGERVEQVEITDEQNFENLVWDSTMLLELLDEGEKRILSSRYKDRAIDEVLPWIYIAKKGVPGLSLAYYDKQRPESLYLSGERADLAAMFKILVGHEEVESVQASFLPLVAEELLSDNPAFAGKTVGTARLENGERRTNEDAIPNLAKNTIRLVLKDGAPRPDWASFDFLEQEEEEPDEAANSGLLWSDFSRAATNSALLAQYSFPTDSIESGLLRGKKSLMNDIPALDAVRQFTQASMRTYMSLPNGDFCAFYPDYFGANRGPYWKVDDIEIIDLRITLNDHSLATHVYVTGSSEYRGSGEAMFERLQSRGVFTIYDAAEIAGLMDVAEDDMPLDPKAFLQHYGARPLAEDNPIIRHHFFEFLMAMQKFMQAWAGQFATEVKFTFQPEVMAGGIIAFPEHNLQMYVESVSHSWDYTSGFTTTAVLSSPATIKGEGPRGAARTHGLIPIPGGIAHTVGS